LKVNIENEARFLSELFKLLPESTPSDGRVTCYWAATFGAHTFAAYVTRADGSVEMMSCTDAAGEFVYRDWARRHQVSAIESYDEWLEQKDKLEPLSWNWGWAVADAEAGFELSLFDDAFGDGGLPPQVHVDAWLSQQFGKRTVKYALNF
jgi:hypothetical protein